LEKKLTELLETPSLQKIWVDEHLGKEEREAFLWIRNHYRFDGISCAQWLNEPDWHLPSRRVWDSFFLLVISGKLRVRLDDQDIEVSAGEVLCLPDGVNHEIQSIGGPLQQLAFHADMNNDVGESLLHRFSVPKLRIRRPDGFVESFQRCAQWMRTDAVLAQERLEHLLWLFLQELLESGLKVEREGFDLDSRIERSMNLLRMNLAHDWSMPEVAKGVGLGSARFRFLFSEALGMGPKSWLMKKRMEKSAEYLVRSEMLVVEVARKVGYSDEHHFQRSFKKWSGLTPTEFRGQKHL
jgi:AraC-like DNA-binding protein